MKPRRIFIAIDISDVARQACVRHIDTLRPQSSIVRAGWEKSEKLHITLRFFGDMAEESVNRLEASLREIAASSPPFRLRLSHPGVFPSPRKPRIFWIGIDDAANASRALAKEIEDLSDELVFKREARLFTPHITIGRSREPERSGELAVAHLNARIEPVEFEVESLVIYESTLAPNGSIYTKFSEIPLRG